MSEFINEASPEYQQYALKIAEQNTLNGIIEEPRIFYDTITLDEAFLETPGHPLVFQNGEKFPVRITHIMAAMARLNADEEVVDPALIQRVGLRLKYHDQYYMNEYSDNPYTGSRKVYTCVPAWAQRPTASANIISPGSSVFAHRPFILSARDAMRVDVRLDATPDAAIPVTVSFAGVGAVSRRPYLFHGTLNVSDTLKQTISPENYKNDGSEPVIITSTTVNCGAPLTDSDPTGDISRLSVGFRQIGNGTQRSWVIGPTTEPSLLTDLAPAVTLGNLSGRAVVHRLPGDGMLWAPSDGLQVYVQNQDLLGNLDGAKVNITLLGYIAVT